MHCMVKTSFNCASNDDGRSIFKKSIEDIIVLFKNGTHG
jgi:hypothetical protein